MLLVHFVAGDRYCIIRAERSTIHARLALMTIGRKTWAIAEGYIPATSHGPQPDMLSHEAVCFLNATDADAHVSMVIYFHDREPAGPYAILVPARRTRHVRFNNLTDPEPIPLGTEYSSVFTSDVPIVVQHTRLDSRQAENALMTTIAFAGDL